MRRYILSIGRLGQLIDTAEARRELILTTNHSSDITLTGITIDTTEDQTITYKANGILKNVARGGSSQGGPPSHGFTIYTKTGTPEHTLLKDSTGRLDAEIVEVEFNNQNQAWEKVWGFKGRLGAGGMVGHLYVTSIEHIVQQTLQTPKIEYFNYQTQRARFPDDAGLEMLEGISRRIFSRWPGTRSLEQ